MEEMHLKQVDLVDAIGGKSRVFLLVWIGNDYASLCTPSL